MAFMLSVPRMRLRRQRTNYGRQPTRNKSRSTLMTSLNENEVVGRDLARTERPRGLLS